MTNKEYASHLLYESQSQPVDRVQLIDILRETTELYTNEGDSYITDAEFDKLYILAKTIMPTDPFFMGVGSTARVDKVRLPYKMGSLDQVQVGELTNWIKSKRLRDDDKVVITDKMDGVSVLLIYDQDGNFQMALTRGDGYEGQDITRHVRLMNVPKKVSVPHLAVRAEIIFDNNVFKKIQSKLQRKDGTPFKNPRNAVSGIVNQSKLNEFACKNLTVFAYDIMSKNYMNKVDQLQFLASQNFTIVFYSWVETGDLSDEKLAQSILSRKSNLTYDIDGIVVDVNDIHKRNLLTSSDLNPAYSFKYKVLDVDNIRRATVVGVEWNISKHGYAKPKIKLEPFDLQGVTISNTTGFNAKYILDNKIGNGTVVNMTRSGDVIPYILNVIQGTVAELPKNIDDYEWSENGVDLILKNKDTSEVKQKQLIAWATSMDIPNLKAGSVEKVYNAGYITPTDLVKMSESQWVSILGANGSKVFGGIREVLSSIDVSKLMGSYVSFGVGIGVRKIKLLLDSDPSLASKIVDGKLTKDDILSAAAFEEKSANRVMDGYAEFMKYLHDIDGLYSVSTTKPIGKKFDGMKICFTGFRDKELEQWVEAEGGTISSGVSKNTNLLVALDPDSQSGKVLKATELDVKVVSKEDFSKDFTGSAKTNKSSSAFFDF